MKRGLLHGTGPASRSFARDGASNAERPGESIAEHLERLPPQHEWDDDGCCIQCGFDGAEWHWWKHSTYEGRAKPDAKQPPCRRRR